MKNWPEASSLDEKVPSIISYKVADSWGYQVRPGDISFTWFKLGLAQQKRSGEHDDPFLKRAIGSRLIETPVGEEFQDLCVDYLREVYRWALKRIEDERGGPETFKKSCSGSFWPRQPDGRT